MTDEATIGDVIDRALAAYEVLLGLGEEIEDEWSYVNDLATVWRDRLSEVSGARGADPAPPEGAVAVDRAIEEIGAITDPHRAIDWLSTFPQVVLVALGEGL
jgi:hypothetical protein